jgi:hypothetical protein
LQASGDLGFAKPGAAQLANFIGVLCCGCGPARTLAVQLGMSQASPHAFTEDLALEAGDDCRALQSPSKNPPESILASASFHGTGIDRSHPSRNR